MARSNLTKEEREDWQNMKMIVETEQVKRMVSWSEFEPTGQVWYEYRSTQADPNGSKYLGVPLLPPPSMTTHEIYQFLTIIFPNVKSEYYENYSQDVAMRGRPQIIWGGYQFLTPRDASMIAAGLFTTLSFHNKVISRLESNREYAARRRLERTQAELDDLNAE